MGRRDLKETRPTFKVSFLGELIDWFMNSFMKWLHAKVIGEVFDKVIIKGIDKVIDNVIDKVFLIDWLVDWLIDWLIYYIQACIDRWWWYLPVWFQLYQTDSSGFPLWDKSFRVSQSSLPG